MASIRTHDPTILELLPLAIAEPGRATVWAAQVIASESDPWVLSVARQAQGIVLRDQGLIELALPELRRAARLAGRSRDASRHADAGATLGLTLVVAGHTRQGLRHLERAASTPTDAA